MKKKCLSVLLIAIMCVSLCACGGSESGSKYDIDFKKMIESVNANGVNWKEYSSKNVPSDFGLAKDMIKDYPVIYTDSNGVEHSAYCQWEEMGSSIRVLRMPPNVKYYETMFTLGNNSEDNYVVETVSAMWRIYSQEKEEASDELKTAIAEWEEGLVPYLSQNNVMRAKELLTVWGVDKLDEKAFAVATDVESTETQEYEFACTSDCGETTFEITNTYQEDGQRRIDINVSIVSEEGAYIIYVYENYEELGMEDPYVFGVELTRPIRYSE